MEKSIYDLKLHESVMITGMCVMRVPGGWIYDCWNLDTDNPKLGTFVPFNIECKSAPIQKELFEDEKPKFNFKKSLTDLGVEEQIASDWLKVRSKKKASNTETVFKSLEKQIKLSHKKANDCIIICIERDWKSFKAEWLIDLNNNNEQKQTVTGY